jgi:hypothetical protein
MKKASPRDLGTADLVADFVRVGIDQDDALSDRDYGRMKRLVMRQWDLEEELERRPGDQRSSLVTLHDHPNMQVRMNAAKATLAIEPAKSRLVLQEIVDSKHFPQAGHAGMTLSTIDRGIFKPT